MKVVMNKLPAINMQVILNNFQYEIVTKEAPGLLFFAQKKRRRRPSMHHITTHKIVENSKGSNCN
jgi:hypothetical protein